MAEQKTNLNYINRELSWLEFNDRVLEEAFDKSNPLFERLKFLAISASNLDEFFMIRVSGIMEQVEVGLDTVDSSGMMPQEILSKISVKVHEMITKQYNCYWYSVKPLLEKENIHFVKYKELDDKQKRFVDKYFGDVIYPVLTPMAIDTSRPFPLLLNKSLNLGVRLKDLENTDEFAIVQVPSILKRFVEVPAEGKNIFILLEDIIEQHIKELFEGYEIEAVGAFRITRDADLDFDEEEAEDLLKEMEKSIKKRKWGFPVRVEMEKGIDEKIKRFLINSLELEEKEANEIGDEDIYEISGPIDLTCLMGFSRLKGFDRLRDKPFVPAVSPDFYEKENMFEVIREKDVVLHHPYETFDHVVEFMRQAATDPDVLAIKQTLYRVSGESPLVKNLILAAENGKQVTVLFEIKARFDEENNIQWAKKLEKSGCHVVYGLVGLKTHCKVLLVVRREEDGIRRYVHLGTGNYNDSTAKLYTDLGMFTCKENYGADASGLFNMLTGYALAPKWKKLAVAPLGLRRFFSTMIENEIKFAEKGKKAKIVAKLNSLVDVQIIKELYMASEKGVEIELVIRGMCSIVPGLEGISSNIKVKSIVGRYLEHHRIFYFENGGDPKVYLGSADWMERNLDRRVEVVFPVEGEEALKKVIGILDITMKDNVKARFMQSDGSYTHLDKRGKEVVNSQECFAKEAVNTMKELKKSDKSEMMKPILKRDG